MKLSEYQKAKRRAEALLFKVQVSVLIKELLSLFQLKQ
ncbi:hypothetical protein VMF7928_00359 [Vibrio marisflavi CECT 7928]|uniref:Uncharacterized protein n=1 Tax=Vibrio marisflavi CECT 7928 TaxID=634439 RepID=A0ABM8ZZ82_9VIBR|nr:hypothetical protein VMF7928_00359 [Vibrio marisflavi CECT 7928]